MDGFIDTILNGLFDIIQSALEIALGTFLGRVLYFAETGLCKIVAMLDQMFQVFAGITKVSYDGEADYLINIFFNNRSITNIYWGMALIGIALAFGFTIAAAVRKMFDASGKQQQSLGQLVTALLRTIFLILGMTAIMVVILNSTNILMQQINYIFNDPTNLDLPETIVYTDEDYAAMGRALNTIGNYSLNPSYSSRYNINTCFNEVRQDLYYLQQRNVFRYYYTTTDSDGNEVNTWQSVLQKVANSHDLRSDLKLDVSYDAVNTALLSAMDIIRNDASFRPLESYTRVVPAEGTLPLDRYVFLMGTMHAAKNGAYNENPELTDAVRGPYYSGEKSIYSISSVTADFDIGYATDYIIVFCACIALIFDLVTIILNCIARIFNMLFLYLIAPPVFATQPFDGGGKTKQWLTAFIVQTFSAFGTVIAMRLLLVMLPIVTSSKLVLFENGLMNAMAKLVMIYGLFEVAKKATGLLTGILADSAGWQSVQAGDMSGSANRLVGGVAGAAKAVGGAALKATGKVADVATKPVQNLAKRGYSATIGKAAQAWNDLGKGDVAGQKAMSAAKEKLAVDQAYAKLTGGAAPGGGSGSGGGAGGDSGGAVSSTLNAGGKVAGGLGSMAASMAGHGDDLPGPSGGGSPAGGGGDGGGSLPTGSGGGTAGGGEGGQTGGGSPGGGAAKTPPPLPGKQGGGGKQPLSAGAQNLFGTDASGKKRPRETPASSGSRPTLGQKPTQAPRSREASSPRKRPTLDSFRGGRSGGSSEKPPPAGEGQKTPPSSGGVSGGATIGSGQKQYSEAAQRLFGVDASGQAQPKTPHKAPPPKPPQGGGGLPGNQGGK